MMQTENEMSEFQVALINKEFTHEKRIKNI